MPRLRLGDLWCAPEVEPLSFRTAGALMLLHSRAAQAGRMTLSRTEAATVLGGNGRSRASASRALSEVVDGGLAHWDGDTLVLHELTVQRQGRRRRRSDDNATTTLRQRYDNTSTTAPESSPIVSLPKRDQWLRVARYYAAHYERTTGCTLSPHMHRDAFEAVWQESGGDAEKIKLSLSRYWNDPWAREHGWPPKAWAKGFAKYLLGPQDEEARRAKREAEVREARAEAEREAELEEARRKAAPAKARMEPSLQQLAAQMARDLSSGDE